MIHILTSKNQYFYVNSEICPTGGHNASCYLELTLIHTTTELENDFRKSDQVILSEILYYIYHVAHCYNRIEL